MLCLFQPPVGLQNLCKTGQHWTLWGNLLQGLCCDDNKIYCVEERKKDHTFWLTLYYLNGAERPNIRSIYKVKVADASWWCHPRVDSSNRVYVPCGRSGVSIFHCQNGRLLPARDPLTCVGNVISICVNTADTVFVGNIDTDSVCLVSVSADKVIRRLGKPAQVKGNPKHMSVLGQKALVCYGLNTLVTYRSDSPTPGQVLQTPEGVELVSSIITDSHSSSFLVTDHTGSVYVLNDKFLWHRIYTDDRAILPGLGLQDCAVVQSQLWLGYAERGLAVLKSQRQ